MVNKPPDNQRAKHVKVWTTQLLSLEHQFCNGSDTMQLNKHNGTEYNI